MTVYQRIDEFIKIKKAYKDLSLNTSIGERGLRQALLKETLTLKVYIEICDYFKLNYLYFISNNLSPQSEKLEVNDTEVKYNSTKKSESEELKFLKMFVKENLKMIIERLDKK